MRRIRKTWMVICMLLLILALVACDSDGTDTTDGAGTPESSLATDVAPVATDDEVAEIDTPMATEEVDIEATEVMTDAATLEPTEAVTPTVEATPTVEMTATAVMTGTGTITDTDSMTSTITQAILASDLVGMDITNEDGEEVGEIAELLIDADGTIQYVIFDVGGFLGIGAKSVAVTWEDMEVQLEDEVDYVVGDVIDPNDFTVRYSGLATDLEDLDEFDTAILDENGYIVDEDLDDTDDFDATPYVGLLEVGEFQDYNLLNAEEEDLGEVEDLIIDLSEGQVTYGVVDFGGFLGIAETTVAVPWEQLELNVTDDDDEIFILDVTDAELEEAPLFDFDAWEYPIESDWDLSHKAFWETQ